MLSAATVGFPTTNEEEDGESFPFLTTATRFSHDSPGDPTE